MSGTNPRKRQLPPAPVQDDDSGDDSDSAFLFGAPKPKPKSKSATPAATTTANPAPSSSSSSTTTTKSNKRQAVATDANTTKKTTKSKFQQTKATTQDNNAEDDEVQLFSTTSPQTDDTNTPTTTTTTTTELTTQTVPWNPFPINTTKGFSQLGVSSWLVSALAKLRIVHPTEIQHRCLPAILQGHNVIARAKTGSGKTAAFALPMLEKLSHDPYGVYGIVVTPTRELALQIKEQFDVFGEHIGIKTIVVIGGVDMVKQAQQIDDRPHIIITTPGRIADLLNRGSIHDFGTNNLKFLVFDEADRLLDDCFVNPLRTLFSHIPPLNTLQVMLFSATITQDIVALQQQSSVERYGQVLIEKPIYLSAAADDDNVVEKLTQAYLYFPQMIKECYIYYLMQFAVDFNLAQGQKDEDEGSGGKGGKKSNNGPKAKDDFKDMDMQDDNMIKKAQKNKQQTQSSNNKILAHKLFNKMANAKDVKGNKIPQKEVEHPTGHHKSCIIFTKTVKSAQFLSLFLREMGIPNVPLHSRVKQARRIQNLNKFRQGVFKVLVATDVAARGLDIPLVTLVINYDLPFSPEDYIHRVGRTARANRNGVALTLVTQYDVEKLQHIEQECNIKLGEFAKGVIDEELIMKPLKIINDTKKVVMLRVEEEEEKYQQSRNQVSKQQ